MTIAAIAFDLDDTLLDTSRLLIPIAGTPEFDDRIKEPLPLMPGALDNLIALNSRYQLFLVTQGNLQVQKQKVQSLEIASYFKEIYFAESLPKNSKRQCFIRLFSENKFKPDQLLCIGNRRSSEIREAKKLGAFTCLFMHGEHIHESPEEPADQPDFEVSNHFEMIKICKL